MSTTTLSSAALATAAGISPTRLERLVQLGVVEPIGPGADAFPAETVARLRRMMRLHDDLGVHLVEAAIIADLLERLDALDAELARLRGRSER